MAGNKGKYSSPERTNIVSVNIGSIAATNQKYLMAAPVSCKILNVTLVCDVATTSSTAGSKEYTFQLANLTQSNSLLSSALSTATTEITADTIYNITPNQNQVIAADDVLELQITKTGSPTDLSAAEVIVQVEFVYHN